MLRSLIAAHLPGKTGTPSVDRMLSQALLETSAARLRSHQPSWRFGGAPQADTIAVINCTTPAGRPLGNASVRTVALIYQAELTPSKPDVLTGWIPRQPWFEGDGGARVTILGSFRFDDPAGEVGIESFLVRFGADSPTLHVPLTYRAEPLELGAGPVGPVATMQHSVLGTRWVYDGARDPVYVAALATTVLTGGTEAELRL